MQSPSPPTQSCLLASGEVDMQPCFPQCIHLTCVYGAQFPEVGGNGCMGAALLFQDGAKGEYSFPPQEGRYHPCIPVWCLFLVPLWLKIYSCPVPLRERERDALPGNLGSDLEEVLVNCACFVSAETPRHFCSTSQYCVPFTIF